MIGNWTNANCGTLCQVRTSAPSTAGYDRARDWLPNHRPVEDGLTHSRADWVVLEPCRVETGEWSRQLRFTVARAAPSQPMAADLCPVPRALLSPPTMANWSRIEVFARL